jgi:hypothetical protein
MLGFPGFIKSFTIEMFDIGWCGPRKQNSENRSAYFQVRAQSHPLNCHRGGYIDFNVEELPQTAKKEMGIPSKLRQS